MKLSDANIKIKTWLKKNDLLFVMVCCGFIVAIFDPIAIYPATGLLLFLLATSLTPAGWNRKIYTSLAKLKEYSIKDSVTSKLVVTSVGYRFYQLGKSDELRASSPKEVLLLEECETAQFLKWISERKSPLIRNICIDYQCYFPLFSRNHLSALLMSANFKNIEDHYGTGGSNKAVEINSLSEDTRAILKKYTGIDHYVDTYLVNRFLSEKVWVPGRESPAIYLREESDKR